jgi:hypothetical protein
MQLIFDIIKWLASPLVRVMVAVVTPISIILGAIANPEGAANTLIIKIEDLVLAALPSTPENLKISYLLIQMGNKFSIVGWGILMDIAQTVALMFGIVILIKVYKLIPFKAT